MLLFCRPGQHTIFTMAIIALEGMHFYAYHGYYEEEQTVGNHYIVDVYVHTTVMLAAATDALESTVNYETIYQICKLEMKKPVKLLETVAQRILKRIKGQFSGVSKVTVRISKQQPPLGGRVERAFVELTE